MPVARGDIREIVGQVRTLLKQGRVGGVAYGNLVSSVDEVSTWSVHRVGGVARGQVAAWVGLRSEQQVGAVCMNCGGGWGRGIYRECWALGHVILALDWAAVAIF